MEANKPVFLGIRQCTEGCEVTVTLDASAGSGGLSMRYDEQFHFDITVDGVEVTATMHISTMAQTWKHRLLTLGPTVDLRLVAEPPTGPAFGHSVGCDWLHAHVLDGDDWVTIASVDGRYLSSDLCESFTGRVVGPFAKSGIVDVLSIDYRGRDIER